MSTAKNDKISCVQKISLTSTSWAVKLFTESKNVRQYVVTSFIKMYVIKILNCHTIFFPGLGKKSQNHSWPAGTELAGYMSRPPPSRPGARANRRRACHCGRCAPLAPRGAARRRECRKSGPGGGNSPKCYFSTFTYLTRRGAVATTKCDTKQLKLMFQVTIHHQNSPHIAISRPRRAVPHKSLRGHFLSDIYGHIGLINTLIFVLAVRGAFLDLPGLPQALLEQLCSVY